MTLRFLSVQLFAAIAITLASGFVPAWNTPREWNGSHSPVGV